MPFLTSANTLAKSPPFKIYFGGIVTHREGSCQHINNAINKGSFLGDSGHYCV